MWFFLRFLNIPDSCLSLFFLKTTGCVHKILCFFKIFKYSGLLLFYVFPRFPCVNMKGVKIKKKPVALRIKYALCWLKINGRIPHLCEQIPKLHMRKADTRAKYPHMRKNCRICFWKNETFSCATMKQPNMRMFRILECFANAAISY